MTDETLRQQAIDMEQLLPRLMRRLFTLDPEHPAAEMPVAQLRVCSILQAGPRTLSAVSAELSISVSATTQIADRLERSGLVERIPGADDRRTRYLQLSAHGQEIMRTRREMRVRRVEEALRELSEEQLQQAREIVEALLKAATATAPAPPFEDPVTTRQEQ